MPTDVDLNDISEVRRLSITDVSRLNKDELQRALKTTISKNGSDRQNSGIEDKLNEILSELKDLKVERESQRKDIEHLKEENGQISDILMQHQRYLESLEAEKRAENLIITGIPESDLRFNNELYTTDVDKCKLIFSKIGKADTQFTSAERLGRQDASKNRFVKLKLASPAERKNILENAKKLKECGETFKRIFIKKDTHPLIRKEFQRIKDVTNFEKQKPENQGKNVRYDHHTRKVMVDDIIVDSFKPSFFQ